MPRSAQQSSPRATRPGPTRSRGIHWTHQRTRRLLELLLDVQKHGGQKNGWTFKMSTYRDIAKKLSEETSVEMNAQSVKNRCQHLRLLWTQWRMHCKHVDEGDVSGYGGAPFTEQEAQKEHYTLFPQCAKFREGRIDHHDALEALYRADAVVLGGYARATAQLVQDTTDDEEIVENVANPQIDGSTLYAFEPAAARHQPTHAPQLTRVASTKSRNSHKATSAPEQSRALFVKAVTDPVSATRSPPPPPTPLPRASTISQATTVIMALQSEQLSQAQRFTLLRQIAKVPASADVIIAMPPPHLEQYLLFLLSSPPPPVPQRHLLRPDNRLTDVSLRQDGLASTLESLEAGEW